MQSFMYLRPGNLYKEFTVEQSQTAVLSNGRPVVGYNTDDHIILKGCLAQAAANEVAQYDQIGHRITHTIVQNGRRVAKEDDRLHLGDRTFLVKGIDEAGNLGICTIYYVEERNDLE